MDISEKILKFAENQKVIDEKLHGDFSNQYFNGYEVGYTEGETAGYGKGYEAGHEAGVSDGKESVPNPLEYAAFLEYIFDGVTFPTGYELTLNIPQGRGFLNAFRNASGITKVTLKGNENGNIVDFQAMFRSNKSIKTLDLTEFNAKVATAYMMFIYCTTIQEILGELDFTECANTQYFVQGCTNLVTITPKANSIKISISFAQSSKLSATSIQSIINGLATVEETQTLTLHLTSSSALTDEQWLEILNKNWSVE